MFQMDIPRSPDGFAGSQKGRLFPTTPKYKNQNSFCKEKKQYHQTSPLRAKYCDTKVDFSFGFHHWEAVLPAESPMTDCQPTSVH